MATCPDTWLAKAAAAMESGNPRRCADFHRRALDSFRSIIEDGRLEVAEQRRVIERLGQQLADAQRRNDSLEQELATARGTIEMQARLMEVYAEEVSWLRRAMDWASSVFS